MDSLDMKLCYFKQMRKLRAFNSPETLIKDAVSLLVSCNKYGKIYVGSDKDIKVISMSTIDALSRSAESVNKDPICENYEYFIAKIGFSITHIALSCDGLTLAVVFKDGSGKLTIGFLDTKTLSVNVMKDPFFCLKTLATDEGISVSDIKWHPENGAILLIVLTNGHVSLMEMQGTDAKVAEELPIGSKSNSACWSPRGKQFYVGRDDGTLKRYDMTFTLKKDIECPGIFNGEPHKVLGLKWMATHFIAVVYRPLSESDAPKLLMVTTRKEGPTAFQDYGDVYMGYDDERVLCYYFGLIAEWNMLITAASNSFEATVVGKAEDKWEKWEFDDSTRAELPLSSNDDETYPVGMALSTNSQLQITEGESVLPPVPVLIIMSSDGVICPFHIINKLPTGSQSLNVASQMLTNDGIRIGKPLLTLPSQSSAASPTPTPNPTLIKNSVSNAADLPKPFAFPSVNKPQAAATVNPVAPNFSAFTQPSPQSDAKPFSPATVSTTIPTTKPPAFGSLFKGTSSMPSSSAPPAYSSIPSQSASKPSAAPTPTQPQMVSFQSALSMKSNNTVNQSANPTSNLGQRQVGSSYISPVQASSSPQTGMHNPNQMATPQAMSSNRTASTTYSPAADNKKAEMQMKAVALSRVLEKSIQEEVLHFENELKQCKSSVQSISEEVDSIGQQDDIPTFKSKINQTQFLTDECKRCTVDHKQECENLKSKLLQSVDICCEAQIRREKGEDPRYLSLMKSRPLNPVSERQRKELQDQVNQLENLLREVNAVLDETWLENERKHSNSRSPVSKASTYQNALKTMEATDKITKTLGRRLETLSLKTDGGNSRRKTSPRKSFLSESELSIVDEVFSDKNRTKDEFKNTTVNISSDKQMRLRDFLLSRTETPIRKAKLYEPKQSPTKSMHYAPSLKDQHIPTPLLTKIVPKAASTPAVSNNGFFKQKQAPVSKFLDKISSIPHEQKPPSDSKPTVQHVAQPHKETKMPTNENVWNTPIIKTTASIVKIAATKNTVDELGTSAFSFAPVKTSSLQSTLSNQPAMPQFSFATKKPESTNVSKPVVVSKPKPISTMTASLSQTITKPFDSTEKQGFPFAATASSNTGLASNHTVSSLSSELPKPLDFASINDQAPKVANSPFSSLPPVSSQSTFSSTKIDIVSTSAIIQTSSNTPLFSFSKISSSVPLVSGSLVSSSLSTTTTTTQSTSGFSFPSLSTSVQPPSNQPFSFNFAQSTTAVSSSSSPPSLSIGLNTEKKSSPLTTSPLTTSSTGLATSSISASGATPIKEESPLTVTSVDISKTFSDEFLSFPASSKTSVSSSTRTDSPTTEPTPAKTTSFAGLFGGVSKASPTSTYTQPGLFSSAAQPSTFGTTSMFGAKTTAVTSSTTTTSSSLFGSASSSVFSSTSESSSSGFATNSLFGAKTTPTATSLSPFAPQPGLFTNSSTTSTGLFGSKPNTTTAASTSSFMQSTSATKSGMSGFGLGGGPVNDPSKNPFGSVTTQSPSSSSTGSSLFGSFAAKTTVPQSQTNTLTPGFGSPASAFSGPSGGFGAAPAFGGAPAFGQAPAFGGSPSFGAAPSFGSSSPAFGGAPSFGSGSPPFGSGIQSSPKSGSIFGQGSSQSGPTFGALAGQSPSGGFAAVAAQSSPTFGALATQQPSTFGQQSSSGFGSFGNTATSPSSGGLFGQQQQQQQSTFGQQQSGGFGSSPSFGGTTNPTSSTGMGGSSFSSWR